LEEPVPPWPHLGTATATATIYKALIKPPTLQCNTTRDAILTCAQKLTRANLVYRRKPTTKKWKTEKQKVEHNNNNNDRLTAFDPGQPG